MALPQFDHQPVLVDAILELAQPAPGQIVLDGTLGLGGHALAILPRIAPDGVYIGLDVDDAMLTLARERLAQFAGARLRLLQANYADAAEALRAQGFEAADLVLLDLGANSAQIDDAARGFSFDRDGPLDMRFDRSLPTRAVDLVNSLSERELADMFYEFGQEGLSRKIAKRICQVRHTGRITTTLVLARAVESALAQAGEVGGKTHPATRVFQALRVAVNSEFENLRRFMSGAFGLLRPGGVLAVISFHSLEDGIVKEALRKASAAGMCVEITRRPVVAESRERTQNPRSRSAKLRVARRAMAA